MMASADSFPEEKLESADGIKRLFRNVADLTRRLDVVSKQASRCEDLFAADVEICRTRLRDCCERLMFYEPVGQGKKAEDLLWRKIYYDVVVTSKKLRKSTGMGLTSTSELALRNHLTTGTGMYHHLLFRIQSEFGVGQGAADFLCLSETTVAWNEKKKCLTKVNVDAKRKDWAVNAFQRCLICLGDLERYKQDLFGCSTSDLSERFYCQAAAFHPSNGMPHNQLGTLKGMHNYGCDAAYHYMRCLMSQQPFEGSEGNLERVFERAQKLFPCNMDGNHCEDASKADYGDLSIRRCLTRFMSFCSTCFFENKESSFRLEQLCEQVLKDLYDCMQFPLQQCNKENGYNLLDSTIIFQMIVMALMCVHHLVSQERPNQSAAIAFALALFSHILQFVVAKLQKQLGISNKTDFHVNSPACVVAVNSCQPNGDSPDIHADVPSSSPIFDENKQNHLKMATATRRRKRNYCSSLEDSDLSEGEHSENAFSESDDANQASDISEERVGIDGEASTSDDEATTEPNGNGIIASQQFDGLKQMEFCELPKSANDGKSVNPHVRSDKCRSRKGNKHVSKGKILKKHVPSSPRHVLSIIEDETLLAVIKICTDWLRCHPNLFTACAQGSQLLWSRLATLLNLLGPVLHVEYKENDQSELASCLEACINGANWQQSWPLPEDISLLGFPLLEDAHKEIRFSAIHDIWLSSSEKAMFRVACLHQFGLFVSQFAETNLSYDEEHHLFKKTGEQESVNSNAWSAIDKESLELQKTQLMKNMAHLRLQAEVTELESTVNLSSMPHLSPYVIVTTAVLVNHMAVLRLLLFSKRFIVVIPLCVIQQLDLLKKESLQAREAIRWLEAEFHRGNRYLRAQKQHEHLSLSPMKYPKRKDKEIWDFFQILECCNHLVQQGVSSRSNHLVTLLIGNGDQKIHDAEKGSWNFEVMVKAVGIKMENIEPFLAHWQDASKNQRRPTASAT